MGEAFHWRNRTHSFEILNVFEKAISRKLSFIWFHCTKNRKAFPLKVLTFGLFLEPSAKVPLIEVKSCSQGEDIGAPIVGFVAQTCYLRYHFGLYIYTLLRRYPGMVPDVDLMFDCMDKPVVNRLSMGVEPETNLEHWDEEFGSIKQGSHATNWMKKWSHAYWKGNADVSSPVRTELLRCNHSMQWGSQIMRQVEFYLHP
ncbi:hypothetical protein IFM89_024024 [Coptis chinensis]|uniref:Glycosyl transferase CAP10 domain-containing protein n=1 Tax=Coptis chinensis TaxID=261450 RepID=A0A835LN96_9MAGN|nr:hypothetical protein IFM89_024024 [Coptis chinensis]